MFRRHVFTSLAVMGVMGSLSLLKLRTRGADWNQRYSKEENLMIDFNGVQLIVENPPLAPVNKKILESIENALNVRFPEYYRDFITTIGTGELADLNLFVTHPYQIAGTLNEQREIFEEYWRWNESSNILTQASAMECIPCFDSGVGNNNCLSSISAK